VNAIRATLLGLCLLASFILPPSTMAGGIELTPFNARYSLYNGSIHIANIDLSLQRFEETWQWRMTTKPTGFFSLFTSKKPTSETTVRVADNVFQLQQIFISDPGNKKNDETAFFDWEQKAAIVERRKKESLFDLSAEVFDFHSVHMLAAQMTLQKTKSRTVDFYHKGRFIKSTLNNRGPANLALPDKTVKANLFEQEMVGSEAKLKYFYDSKNNFLPLRIERQNSGDSTSIMVIKQVIWGS
jgi:hypothetical protein